jgi:Leucine-rich repeat (LRR) protein
MFRFGRFCLIASVLCGLTLMTASCSKSKDGIDGTDESRDHVPPSAITDLAVTNMSPTGAALTWTAPGDDADSGLATAYDLRYFGSTITELNWDSAAVVTGVAAPSPTQMPDSATVTELKRDSTYFFAIKAADESGNWSHLSNVTDVTCLDNVKVSISDTALERIIRFQVNRPIGDIYQLDLLDLFEINAWNQHIQSLGGLEHCANLQALRLFNNAVADLTPLAGLGHLRVLDLSVNGLADNDLAPLASLTELDTLKLSGNQFSDLSPLTGLDHLSFVDLSYNAIWILSPLAGHTSIRELSLDGNQIVFVNALYGLTGLERLRLTNNQIDDLLPLAYNTGLGVGDTVWLTSNPLSAISTDSLIGVLEARGVTVVR